MISITVNAAGHQLDIEDAATVGHSGRRYGLPMQPVIMAMNRRAGLVLKNRWNSCTLLGCWDASRGIW